MSGEYDKQIRLQEMLDCIQVGALLCYQWGYDQTNNDFYQVVERRGRAVILRAIGSEGVPGSAGFMCEDRRPIPDKFIGEPFRKIIGPWGIKMAHGHAQPTTVEKSHYCSWYA